MMKVAALAHVAHVTFWIWTESLLGFIKAQQLSNNPSSYFGGTNHDAYLDWIDSKNVSSRYQASVYLPASAGAGNGAAIHWKINELYLEVAVAARASGFVGFGIAEAGGMLGADIVYFEASRPNELVDAYVLEDFIPYIDDCQHWLFVDSAQTVDGDFLMFEGRRLLDTGDNQDHKILNDTAGFTPAHRIVAAWGNQDQIGYHGRNVARGLVRFHGFVDEYTGFKNAMLDFSEGHFDVIAKEYPIKTTKTQYEKFCASRADLIAQGVPDTLFAMNLVGFEPRITSGSEAYVHHFLVLASIDAFGCSEDRGSAFEMIYSWTPGTVAWALPDFLGIPLFGLDGFNSYRVEIHYNNPNGDVGVVDSSGIRLYYTSQPKRFALGSLVLADPYVAHRGERIGAGLSSHNFHIPPGCTIDVLQNGPITVVKEVFHMHQSAVRMVNKLTRNGQTVHQASLEVWDFDQQGSPAAAQDSFVIMPGDEISITCFYRDPSGDTIFGIASDNQMCMSQFFYYPRLPYPQSFVPLAYGLDLPNCMPSYTNTSLKDSNSLDRIFGTASSFCAGPLANVSSPFNTTLYTGVPTESSLPASPSKQQPLVWSGTKKTRTWLFALVSSLSGAMVLFCVIGSSSMRSRMWTGFVTKAVHSPLLVFLRVISQMAARNPIRTMVVFFMVSTILMAVGLSTNFRFETDEAVVWAPSGSFITEHTAWVKQEFPKKLINEDDTGEHRIFTLLFHNDGENVLSRQSLTRIFQALDTIRTLEEYDQACAGLSCSIKGVPQFWNSNTTLFRTEIASDEDATEVISSRIFPDGDPVVEHEIFGHAQRSSISEDHRLTSVTSYTVKIELPSTKAAQTFEQEALRALLDLENDWEADSASLRSLHVAVNFPSSYDSEAKRSVFNDLYLIPIAFGLLNLYTAAAFWRQYGGWSKGLLGIGAVITCMLSMSASMGLMFLIGVKVTVLTPSLFFIVLGIGIDDAFIIMGSFTRMDSKRNVGERVSETMNDVGVSITVTSLTSALAFGLGGLSSIPGVRWLCCYAFVMILVDFLFQVTFFVALMVLDDCHTRASFNDECNLPENDEEMRRAPKQMVAATVSTPVSSSDHSWDRFMRGYAEWLLQPRTKAFVLLSFFVLTGMGAYSTFQMKQAFALHEMVPKGSYAADYEEAFRQYSSVVVPVVYVRSVNQSNVEIQKQMAQYVRELVTLGPFNNSEIPCWFSVVNVYSSGDRKDVLSWFGDALNLDGNRTIAASRCQLRMNNVSMNDPVAKLIETFEWVQALTERQPLNQGKDKWPIFTYSAGYRTWEFFTTCKNELMTTSMGTVAAICLVTSIFIPHWTTLLFIVPTAIVVYIDLVGVLQWAGIDINPVSYVTLVVCIGVSIDYIIHVLVRFHESAGNRKDRTVAMLETVGISILLSGLSSILGVLPLALSTSAVGFTFFIAFFGFVTLGLLHALILMPVILSTLGPEEEKFNKDSVSTSSDESTS